MKRVERLILHNCFNINFKAMTFKLIYYIIIMSDKVKNNDFECMTILHMNSTAAYRLLLLNSKKKEAVK